MWANFRSDSLQQGGSTITQQYVKNVYLSQERTVTRKVKEAALAVKLERELPKREILTRYLNTIYFGRGAYGVEAASRAYFGKSVGQLTLPDAAYLAGLIRAPETADARLPADAPSARANRDTATQRRNSVLRAMVETASISQEQYDATASLGFDDVLPRSDRTNFGQVARPEWGTEHYVEYVRRWLATEGGFTDAQIYGGGLRVYTTLDMRAQGEAAEAITSTLDQPYDPAAALVSIDDQGAVRAMIGGLDYNGASKVAKLNLATLGDDGDGLGRQPGSSFKMFTLAAAMVQGIPLNKTYKAPAKLVIPKADNGKDYTVSNYADAGFGTLDLVQATMKSSNTAFVQLMQDVGPQNVVDLAHRMGITSELDPVLSLTLGTGDVSVLDMASAYSTLADGGTHTTPYVVTKVTDAGGKVLFENEVQSEKVLEDKVVEEVGFTLNQVVEGGTGTGAKIAQPAAGKTGTTEDYRDAWFVGYTCQLTTAVWMGYPTLDANGQSILMKNVHGKSVTGGSFPATIWNKYMAKATDGLDSCAFPKPTLAPYVPPPSSSGGSQRPRNTTTSTIPTTTEPSAPATTEPPAPTPTTPPTPPPTTTPTVPATVNAPTPTTTTKAAETAASPP